MAETTAIEWADHTFDPWLGCTKISAACDHCYAETLVQRYGWTKWGAGEARKRTSEANWRKPLSWNRAAARDNVRRRVFCASLADVFDAEVAEAWRLELMQLIHATANLDWLLLTKRPQVAKKFFLVQALPSNVWLGTTVESQAMADLRIPILLSTPARVRFLSCEPLLGPIDLTAIRQTVAPGFFGDALQWHHRGKCHEDEGIAYPTISWVIAGGESGHGARPSHPDWLRSLRDQCHGAAVPFFFKQWGSWQAIYDRDVDDPDWRRCHRVECESPKGQWLNLAGGQGFHGERVVRAVPTSKVKAGAKLDGREWREFPQ